MDEYDLLQILQGEDAAVPALPPGVSTPTPPEETPGQSPGDPAEPETPKKDNSMGMLIMVLVIAAIGGGAFYYFKVLKPKQGGGNKKSAGVSELDEFNFDADEDDYIGADTTEQDGGAYEGDEDMPDFTAAENNESEDI